MMAAHQTRCHRWNFILASLFVVKRCFSVMLCELPYEIEPSMHDSNEPKIAMWVEGLCTIASCDQIDNIIHSIWTRRQ